MSESATIRTSGARGSAKVGLRNLVGAGDKIGRLLLPFVVVGIALNVWRPELFGVGGPSAALAAFSAIVLVVGVVVWLWSAVLILTKVPRRELITSGPFALVKHPLYTGVGLLVLPWAGFLLNTWLGALLGTVLYVASRRYAPAEERVLSKEFGPQWYEYSDSVKLPWL